MVYFNLSVDNELFKIIVQNITYDQVIGNLALKKRIEDELIQKIKDKEIQDKDTIEYQLSERDEKLYKVQIIMGMIIGEIQQVNKHLSRCQNIYCNSIFGTYRVIENENLRIILSDHNPECQIIKKENNETIFARNENGTIMTEHKKLINVKNELLSFLGINCRNFFNEVIQIELKGM